MKKHTHKILGAITIVGLLLALSFPYVIRSQETFRNVEQILNHILDTTNDSFKITLVQETITNGMSLGGDITLENSEVIDNATDGTVALQAVTALTNTVDNVLQLEHTTSGSPANGIGTGLQFETETTAGNEIGAVIEAVTTDVTSASEDFDLVIKTMTAGAAATEKFRVGSTLVEINGPGADVDTIVEGDTDTLLVYANAGTDRVGISTDSPDKLFHVEETTALTNTVTYPVRVTHDSTGTHANNIGVGVEFEQETAAANFEVIATIEAIVADVTDTSEDGEIVFKTMTAGAAATEKFMVGPTEVVHNDASADIDLRAEGDGDANLVHINAGTDRVGISTDSPDKLFHVEETTALTNTVTYPVRVTHDSTGTHANNIGVGVDFEQETAADNFEVIATIEAIAADVTDTSEDGEIVFKTMTAGAAATEKMRVHDSGEVGFLYGVLLAFKTADPCGSGFPEGTLFWNDTANVPCFCDGTNDLKVADGAACF